MTSYAGLVVCRAFLGLVEGPMFPGIVLYLSGFYTRAELSLRYAVSIQHRKVYKRRLSSRVAVFFSSASVREFVDPPTRPGPSYFLQLSGSFSGLLSAAIMNMDGIGGKAGWSWIFILVRMLRGAITKRLSYAAGRDLQCSCRHRWILSDTVNTARSSRSFGS